MSTDGKPSNADWSIQECCMLQKVRLLSTTDVDSSLLSVTLHTPTQVGIQQGQTHYDGASACAAQLER